MPLAHTQVPPATGAETPALSPLAQQSSVPFPNLSSQAGTKVFSATSRFCYSLALNPLSPHTNDKESINTQRDG